MATSPETCRSSDGSQPAPRLCPLTPAAAEARGFWRMRGRLIANTLHETLTHSWLRVCLIAFLSSVLWLVLFWLFVEGFHFVKIGIPRPETYGPFVRAVFGFFYTVLMGMLVFSTWIILYGSLFRGPDIPLLLTLPTRAERVFLYKFQEAVLLSSWAFLLLGSPMLLAYGIVVAAPWYYYLLLVPFLAAFAYIPAGVGAMLCLAIVRWLPSFRSHVTVLVGAAILALGLCVWVGWWLFGGAAGDLLTPTWFQGVLRRLSRFSECRLLPSWWLSTGVLEAARSNSADGWSESIKFLALTISNALLCRQLAGWTAMRIYRTGYRRLHGHGAEEDPRGGRWVDRSLAVAALWTRMIAAIDRAVLGFPLLPNQVRLLIVKDLRLFRRDPVQWSQFAILLALLFLYFVNIRSLTYDVQYVGWVNMVSFLNLSVVGLLLSTFTTRFIFPLVSLEGRRFWVLGLLPVRRERILWGKFLFAAGSSLIPCCLLILLSDAMLRVSPVVMAIHQLTCLILSLGLSGIAVGLGATMPNLREQSPSRIAAGFGGTLNLVLSALYIVAVVGLTALPCHFYLAAGHSRAAVLVAQQADLQWWLHFWLLAGTGGSLLLGVVATVVPLWMGFRAFRALEF